ncbi:cbb3-type cytochrome oxidase assembly protein CcoS [Novispirillum itersonii]|uniref:cbb3-type cytochrome oxidase assembly protein CcoS n=1 Tax=Novispirillum itersonii TaxID=189 RepID=UPI000366473F|nr:cbb3-type cytochrome oxidase assembly protein CcoS [Novispirillum itersonii]
MSSLLMLIPVALMLGLLGLGAFLWALKSGQFDDLDGAAHRILFDDDDDMVTPRQSAQTPPESPNSPSSGPSGPISPSSGPSGPVGSAGGPT